MLGGTAQVLLAPMLRQVGSVCAFALYLLNFQLFQSQTQLQQVQQQQPGSSRSLSFLSSAGALQRGTGIPAAAASPVQQLNQTQRFLPLSWQQSLQQQQWEMLPLLQHMPGQQLRHFVLMPRRVKYRKAHKSMGFNETICGNTRQLAFGLYGVRALEHCRMPAATLEAVRWGMMHAIICALNARSWFGSMIKFAKLVQQGLCTDTSPVCGSFGFCAEPSINLMD